MKGMWGATLPTPSCGTGIRSAHCGGYRRHSVKTLTSYGLGPSCLTPAAFYQDPALALFHPMMRLPMLARARRLFPAATDPYV
jgi:hypothetical protein